MEELRPEQDAERAVEEGRAATIRVGLDYLPAVTHWPGVGRYARELVRALVRLDACPEIRLLEFGAERRTIGEPALGLEGHDARVRRVSMRLPRRALRVLHRVAGRGADSLLGGVDLFHRILPDFPPVARAPQSLAVGELPEPGSEADARVGAKLREMDRLFVASRHAERELARRYDLPPERISFVSLGCDHWRRDLPEPPPPPELPVLLVLGAVRRDRRQVEILGAFEQLLSRRAARRLVLVGGGIGPERERLRAALARSPARRAVEWIEAPVEADLPRLVAGASVLVHLSRGEETAVTPLEAFSFGTAVVTNGGGPFEEALEREAVHVDADTSAELDRTELAARIGLALETASDEQARARRRAVAAPFTWESSARRTVRAWEEIVAR